MARERDRIAEVASRIAEGGWSSIYSLVSSLTEEQLSEYFYEEICNECDGSFDEDELDEDGLCDECAKKVEE